MMAPTWRKTVQDSPESAQDGPNIDPRGPKRAPRSENLHFIKRFFTFLRAQDPFSGGQSSETSPGPAACADPLGGVLNDSKTVVKCSTRPSRLGGRIDRRLRRITGPPSKSMRLYR